MAGSQVTRGDVARMRYPRSQNRQNQSSWHFLRPRGEAKFRTIDTGRKPRGAHGRYCGTPALNTLPAAGCSHCQRGAKLRGGPLPSRQAGPLENPTRSETARTRVGQERNRPRAAADHFAGCTLTVTAGDRIANAIDCWRLTRQLATCRSKPGRLRPPEQFRPSRYMAAPRWIPVAETKRHRPQRPSG